MATFSDFNLPNDIQRALEEKNFTTPTPIQEQVIPQILTGSQDVLAIAQTGTGKTAAFSLPVLAKMDPSKKHVQTLVLSPTRELAMQIAKDMKQFAKYLNGIHVAVVYGGASIQDQVREIRRGAQVIVGTPGRLLDMCNRKVLKLENVEWVILDEADEMLKMGFIEDINEILGGTPDEKQTLLFSATMSRTIEQIAGRYMHSPLRVEAKATEERKAAISHQFMMVPARDKIVAFKRYRELHPEMYGIVFCETKRETQEVGDALLKQGVSAAIIHGDIEQRHRTRIMEAFKRKEITLLVATDVAARGIDVEKLTHVIHFGCPDKIESYVHRSGRTGRASEKGVSLVLAHLREHYALKRIEQAKGFKFEEVPAPKREDLIHADLAVYIKMLSSDTKVSPLAQKYLDEILGAEEDRLDMEQLARKALLIAIEEKIARHPEEEMDRPRHKREPDRRESGGRGYDRGGSGGYERGGRRGGRDREEREEMSTLIISLGRRDDLTVPNLLSMINQATRGSRVDIGLIQISDSETSFGVPTRVVGPLSQAMSRISFKGKKIFVKEGTHVRRSGPGGRR